MQGYGGRVIQPQGEAWRADIQARVDELLAQLEVAFATAPQISRKDFTRYVDKHQRELAGCLFARLDDKDVRQMLLERGIDVPEEEG